jgi:hypothetical protein
MAMRIIWASVNILNNQWSTNGRVKPSPGELSMKRMAFGVVAY